MSNKKPRKCSRLLRIAAELFSDLCIVVGGVAIFAGVCRLCLPVGLIVGGLELIALGYLTLP